MCRSAVAALALVALLLPAPAAGAQDSTPPGAPGEGAPLLRLTLDELAPGNAATIGVTRTTYDPGGSLRAVAGAGPGVFLVETGALAVDAADAPRPPVVVRAGDEGAMGTPETAPAGGDVTLEAGDAIVLPAGGTAEIRNDGATPAVTLDLLAATDARSEDETGVAHVVMSREQATLPAPPVTVELARATIAPGDRFPFPPAPALAALATVDRAQTFLLSGEGINRGQRPMEVYVVTIAPVAGPTATPEAGTPAP